MDLKNAFLALAFLLLWIASPSAPLFAQAGEDWVEESDIDDAQLVIEKNKVLTLPKANRPFGKMNRQEKKGSQSQGDLEYTLRLTDFELPPIEPNARAISMDPPPPLELYRGYAKLGFGNYLAPYAEAYYGSGREEQYRYGVGLQHFSAINGPVDQEFSGSGRSAAFAHGKLNGKEQSLEGKIGYTRRNAHYYGYSQAPAEADSIRQIYNEATFQALWDRKELGRSPISFSVGLDGSYFFDNYEASEAEASVSIKADYELSSSSKVHIELLPTLNLRYNGAEETQNRSLGKATLAWRYQQGNLQAVVGAKVAYNMDSTTTLEQLTFYPDVFLQYTAIPKKLYITAYAKGDLQQNTLRNATRENPFLNTATPLSHSHQQLDAGLEVEFAPSRKLGLSLEGGYELVENRMLMVNSPTDLSRFSLIYDGELTGALKVGGKVEVSAGRIKATLGSQYRQYSMEEVRSAYHLPALQNELSIGYYHPERLTLRLEGFQWSGITALDEAGSDITLDPIIDLNLYGNYQITDMFGVFLQLKNLTAQNYQRYYRYSVRGFQILGGGSVRF